MFKVLAFRSLCLVPNKIDFVLSWPKCTLNLLSTSELKNFPISVKFFCWKTMEVSSA